MKPTHIDEFNLSDMFTTLWRKKYTFFFINVVSLIFGIFYSLNQPISYIVSTPVYHSKHLLFMKYKELNEILKTNETVFYNNELDPYFINSKIIFERFVVEFQDYEEMIIVLKKNKSISKLIKDLKEEDQRKRLISYAKSFTLSNNSNKNNFILSFNWHNDIEGKHLFKEAILLTLENVKNSLINEVMLLSKTMKKNNIRIIQNLENQIDLIEQISKLEVEKRIQYLSEQYSIAKEMDIESNLFIPVSNVMSNQVNVLPLDLKNLSNRVDFDMKNFIAYDNNFNNLPYYLRGYKAIQKEIELIKSRSKEENLLRSSAFVYLKQKMLAIKKNTTPNMLENIADDIKNDFSENWIEFNFELANTNITNKKYNYVIISLIIGFILSSTYILIHTFITNTLISKKAT
jgi:hypothetical protein